MATFVKAQVSSFSASILDFLTTIVCKHLLNFGVILGSSTGTTVGGIVNFIIGRNWVFDSKEGKIQNQVFRYFIVWFGNLILTTTGVYLVTHYFQLSNYVIPKILVSGLVGVPYNYLMQKRFVFT